MRLLFILLALFVAPLLRAQDWVLNGSFEEENTCTEFDANCAPEAWICNNSGLESYGLDPKRAASGKHFMIINAGHETKPFNRSFIRTPLLCPLIAGQRYRVSFKIKSLHYLFDSIGIYFSPFDPLLERKPMQLLSPSAFLSSGNHFTKDTNWQQVNLEYTANGEEEFLSIGSFARNDLTGPTNIYRERRFLYLIDDVHLFSADNDALCPTAKERKENIYSQNERHQFLRRSLAFKTNHKPLPLKRQPETIPRVITLQLPDLLFETSKADVRPGIDRYLDTLCRSITGRVIDSIVVEGHTDSTGLSANNMQLSAARAENVAQRFRACPGLNSITWKVRGLGSMDPVADNRSASGRQRNRRVELRVYIRE